MNRESVEKFTLSIRLRHEKAELSSLAENLQLRIDRAWKAGDAVVGRTGISTGSRQARSYVSSRVITSQDLSSFHVAVENSLENLQHHKTRLQSFIDDGGTVELFVGWFFEVSSGLEIQPQTLAWIGNLGLTLSIAAYGGRITQHSET